MNLQDAQTELEQALALEGLVHAQLLDHMGQDEPAASRTRHLQAEIEAAARKVSLARVKCQAAAIRAELESRQVQEAAQDGEEAARHQYRDECLRVLPERQIAAADALVELVIAAIGSGTVAPGFAQSPGSWVSMLARTPGVDVGQVALQHVRARSLGAP